MSKSIADSSWSTFFNMLQYKAENAGNVFYKVVASGTSQRCSRCNVVVKKTLAIRTHCCPNCGLNIDRDYNASINILQKGLNVFGLGNLLSERKEVTPVEIEPLQIENSLQVRSQNEKQEEATGLSMIGGSVHMHPVKYIFNEVLYEAQLSDVLAKRQQVK